MRIVLLFLMLSANIILKAQEVRIGINFSPAFNYYTVLSDLTYGTQNFKQQNKPVMTLNAGFLLFKPFSEGVTFVTGLNFAQRGVRSQFNTSNISAFNFSNSGYDMKISDKYLEIPLIFNFNLTKESKLIWFGSVGLKPVLYLYSTSKLIGGNQKADNYNYPGHRRVSLFGTLGFGAELTLSKKIEMIIWPYIDHALIGEVYASPLRLFPYSAGINLCLTYSLGN